MATPENGKEGRKRGSPSRSTVSRLAWLGHGTVLLDLDGVRLLTDPLLRDRVSYLRRRAARVDPADYAGVDAVLLSHLHFDHLDFPSLRMVGRGTPLVVPRGGGRLLVRDGFRRVVEVEVGEEIHVSALTVRAVHAEHADARSPLGPRAPALGRRDHLSYVVNSSCRLECRTRGAPCCRRAQGARANTLRPGRAEGLAAPLPGSRELSSETLRVGEVPPGGPTSACLSWGWMRSPVKGGEKVCRPPDGPPERLA